MPRNQNHLITPSEWAATGESVAATAQTVTHSPGAAKRSYVAGLLVQASATERIPWNLDSPDGTVHAQGFTVAGGGEVDFDPPLDMPLGADVRLEVAAGGVGTTTRANMWGYDLNEPALP